MKAIDPYEMVKMSMGAIVMNGAIKTYLATGVEEFSIREKWIRDNADEGPTYEELARLSAYYGLIPTFQKTPNGKNYYLFERRITEDEFPEIPD